MKQTYLNIRENDRLRNGLFRMVLEGDVSAFTAPGQFLNIRLEGCFLRRPISVHDLTADAVTIVYKTVGEGTEKLSRMKKSMPLDVLTGLGNGFACSRAGTHPLLLGGGIGSAPLLLLARRLRASGLPVSAVLGFNTAEEIFCEEELKALGCDVRVATLDGSAGTAGYVTDALPEAYSYYYACGPEPMLRAVFRTVPADGELSFEARMGCGFGACMGCTCETVAGPKRICREGPVLRKGELIWAD